MKNKYNYLSVLKIAKALLIALVIIAPGIAKAQIGQQEPSIQAGVTFQWVEPTQPNNTDPATIQSVTVGTTVYNTFVVPSSYTMNQVGPDGHGYNRIYENGVINPPATSINPLQWDPIALDAFQDKNLNHYFSSNKNGRAFCYDPNDADDEFAEALITDAQRQTISYSEPIPSNSDGILAVTERGGNNCLYIEVYGFPVGGGPEQLLGNTFVRNDGNYTGCTFGAPNTNSDYWKSGRCNDNGQTIGIALFYLNELAPTGSNITKIVFVGASVDHGDGKFFLLQKYVVDQQNEPCLNETYNGDLRIKNNAPANSTYTLTSGPTPAAAGSLTLNSNGTYTYVPNIGYPGFPGNVTFEYELCLPPPNSTVCDTGGVTLMYVDLPPEPTFDINCGLGDDNFTITVTSPLNTVTDPNQYEYSIDNGVTYQTGVDFTGLSEGSYSLMVKSTYTTCVRTSATNPIILVNDDEDPTGTAPNGVVNVNLCSADAQTTYPFDGPSILSNYSDNCNGNLTINLTNTDLSGDNCGWTLTYTYEIVDASNNKLEGETITHTGSDQDAATGTTPSGTTGINACANETEIDTIVTTATDIADIEADYTDDCGTVTATFVSQAISGDACAWSLERTYNISDGCPANDFTVTITHTGSDQDAATGTTPTGTTGINACANETE
ncbi:Ig-like domain-containing protein, partial [Algibacter sp. 2305UL17-15]|uniref:Ig-like domain-containing protein n=1 Tax=Algibacter sp. 2305UL17-15 TaxID=3231268 RepID=UPI00345959E1